MFLNSSVKIHKNTQNPPKTVLGTDDQIEGEGRLIFIPL